MELLGVVVVCNCDCFQLLVFINIMYEQEISPWQNEPTQMFTLQYNESADKTNRKLSQQIDPNRKLMRHRRKKTTKLHSHQECSQQHLTVKNALPTPMTSKSKHELLLFKCEQVNKELRNLEFERNNKSSIFTLEKLHSIGSEASVRKHTRIKIMSKPVVKEVRFEEIFKKMTQIQNPTNRENLSLPKIHIKI